MLVIGIGHWHILLTGQRGMKFWYIHVLLLNSLLTYNRLTVSFPDHAEGENYIQSKNLFDVFDRDIIISTLIFNEDKQHYNKIHTTSGK